LELAIRPKVFRQLTPKSLYGASKTLEETEKSLKNILPAVEEEGKEKTYRVGFAVHEILYPSTIDVPSKVPVNDLPTRFIGLVSLRSLSPDETTSLPHLGHASTPTTLSLEIAYMFLPTSWGHGYATESINAVFDACKRAGARGFWAPFEKAFVRAIVNDENRPSQRVMEKCGMDEPEVLEFEGGRYFIAGIWREKHRLFVYGRKLEEQW
jgi:RimJ/RimL family protein N-acetyltransferase